MLSASIVLAACVALASTWVVSTMVFGKKKWDPAGKVRCGDISPVPLLNNLQHCVVTGGSAGLGLSLAILLAKRGAHVSIVARNQERLDKALKEVEVCPYPICRTQPNNLWQAARQSPEQVLLAYSYGVDSAKEAEAALDAAAQPHDGRCPDALFLCAGKSRPGFWIEQTEAQLRECMEETYWVQAWPALVCTLSLRRRRVLTGIYRRRRKGWSRKA